MDGHLTREEQKEIKKRLNNQYQQLEKLVNEWDPIGLIRGGAPKDEYDCLTAQLLALLHEGKNAEELMKFIITELDEHFGYGLSNIREDCHDKFLKKCSDVSVKIVDWWGNNSDDQGNVNQK
ncbi:hypothetical protein [Acetonema longum]|uniref:Uncharacterized protein n=1 Tax=Acetonema longum DSM 6540 TaxID=1009370 RepID=F7NKM4_9FIRM|nr:hypothetical protein [Acetonema longum]EGO63401.1 hypothetical protein ALO_13214 [Acetonema longum DSM 6540]